LSWAEGWWRIALAARIGAREHRAVNPWRVSLTTTWLRALLQCLFFTMLGRVVGGEAGQAYTYVGSVAIIITLFTFGELGDVPMRDRWSATFHRLRLGRLPVPLVYAVRSWPAVAEGLLLVVVSMLVVGVLTGQGELMLRLLALLPCYALMVATSAAAGLAVSSIGLFGREGREVIVGNVAMYLVIVASGALIPPGKVAALDVIGTVLPMRHALQAVRGHLAGQPWVGDLLAELAVGAAWAATAVLVYTVAVRRVRHTDHDKVT
jgi:ABC-2 type transport system permease protein